MIGVSNTPDLRHGAKRDNLLAPSLSPARCRPEVARPSPLPVGDSRNQLTRTAADDFARPISGVGSLGLHCLSLTQVISEIAVLKSAEFGLAPLSRLGEEAVAAGLRTG
jgi:hypothetical protein